MGNRKKLEKVWASKTSLTETAMNRPRNVDVAAMRTTAGKAALQAALDKSVKKAAKMTGTKALATPKRIAPEVLASIKSSRGMGASSSLSKDRPFFSKVTVTASMEVVPKRMETATTPGSRDLILSMLPKERFGD